MPYPVTFNPETKPAHERYPEPLAGLLRLGGDAQPDYRDWANQLRACVPDLIRMVLDVDLNTRAEDDPALWAPVHAMEVLIVLAPPQAAAPLLACLGDIEGWADDLVRRLYAAIGPAALPILAMCLADARYDVSARGRASNVLAAIAEAHPTARQDVIDLLTAFLDRPTAARDADEETVTGFVIGDLGELGAVSAYDAIRRAFAQDRVDPQIIDLESIERDFGMRSPLDLGQMAAERPEPGVRLGLKCKACGRERSYVFPKAYYELGTARDPQKRARYSPLIIPQRVVCSKCGAVDQVELSTLGELALTGSLLSKGSRPFSGPIPKQQSVQPIEFTTRWGAMHPQEALAHYEAEILRRPDDPELHIGIGNVFNFLGYFDEAEAAFRRATALTPDDPEAWVCLAQLAGARGDAAAAITRWEQVIAVASQGRQDPSQRQAALRMAHDSLRELRQGQIPEFTAPTRAPGQPRVSGLGAERGAKVGRNDPCPCGSGKKYKHCHGRSEGGRT